MLKYLNMTITLANGSHIGERASLLALVFHKIAFTLLHIKGEKPKDVGTCWQFL